MLLTYFEAFGGQSLNASKEAVLAMDAGDLDVIRVELPCVFGRAIEELRTQLETHQPDLVVCVGQAGGRPGISLERVAINVDDARIPDNAGATPIDVPIVDDGPAAYFSTLPIKAIVHALRRAGLPAEVSQSAGTFVCNHVFYGLMHELKAPVRGGFVHVPFLPSQGTPSLTVSDQARALTLLVRTALTTDADVKLAGGATH